jgi:hypothetical protein
MSCKYVKVVCWWMLLPLFAAAQPGSAAGRCWCMGDLFGAFMVFPTAQCKAQEVYIYTYMYKL